MKQIKSKLAILYLFVTLITTSCTEYPDYSSPDVDLGKIFLSDSTLNKLPYQDPTQQIVFIDSLNNEYIANIIPTVEEFNTGSTHYPYENSTDDYFFVRHQKQELLTKVKIPELDKIFWIETSVQFRSPNSEVLKFADRTVITVLNSVPQTLAGISITADRRSFNVDIQYTILPVSSIIIQGKEYKNVYTSEQDNLFTPARWGVSVYFTFEQGIIAFRDKQKGITYSLKQ